MTDALCSRSEASVIDRDHVNMQARSAWDRAHAERDAGDIEAACRWMERAHRLAPDDALVQLILGALLLQADAAPRAVPLLERVARTSDVPEAWIALASCHLALDAKRPCVDALERALRSRVVDAALEALARRVVERFHLDGWCGVDKDGRVRSGPGRPAGIAMDAVEVRGRKLPRSWRSGRVLAVAGSRGPLLGSPLDLQRLCATSGFVTARAGGIEGWAWHPGDPDRAPLVEICGASGSIVLTASGPADGIDALPPLAQPRRFALDAAAAEALGTTISVRDLAGQDLLGSPLDPGLEHRGSPGFAPSWADLVGTAPAIDLSHRDVDVVIPVYGNAEATLACLDSVLATVASPTIVHVVDDASPDPALLDVLQADNRIRLLRLRSNRGFPSAANAGLRAAAGRDVVLLNSDTLVAPGWLDRLRRAAYAQPDTGSATSFSNEATIVSYPSPQGGNPVPDQAETALLDRLAQRANPAMTRDLPVGVGFCLYLRRDCLDQVGLFREDLFAQGYGEENDLCLRARRAGWRHVAALDVFVSHVGGGSFRAGAADLRRRNAAILNRHHPGYDALIAAHELADTLFEGRRRMDALRWSEAAAPNGAVLLVTHDEGGGVAELVASRRAELAARGQRPIVVRPAEGGCQLDEFANLRFRIPNELADLADLLRPQKPARIEVHHLLGHHRKLLDLACLLDVPTDTWVHDYASFCPRIALVDGGRRYCGEPQTEDCEACVADFGTKLDETIAVPSLLARSAAEFEASRRVVAPTHDAARRLRRHFPAARPEVAAWEDDRAWPPPRPVEAGALVRICVVGAIGVEKGYDVLLGCARDARRRGLKLEFVVCGYTEDDERLLAAGPVFVTGRYAPEEAVELIGRARAHLALIPSIWPEVWCFALSRAWEAGLHAVAFDLGAQAERIRATGRGTLLPLGLPPPATNDALLRLARSRPALQSPQP